MKMLKKNNNKGSATVYLVIAVLVALFVAFMFIKLNWRRFKADASFAFAITAIVIVALLAVFLLIRHSIKKSRKEKEKGMDKRELERAKIEEEEKKLEKEKARLESEEKKLEKKKAKEAKAAEAEKEEE